MPERIVAVLASEQGEWERLTHGVADDEASLGARSVELEHAEQECAEAERDHNDERRAEAVRRLVRVRDAHAAGDQLLADRRGELSSFEEVVAVARTDAPIVERRVAEFAATLPRAAADPADRRGRLARRARCGQRLGRVGARGARGCVVGRRIRA